ncbi:hypothetical protein P8C59_007222 [Phyllachora maydis]|uniref:Mitochondrial intermediate peptidase n=1 Tax=Phyllachora maydis TaxID=1825666 RepID=A0AAD9I8A7_9PEZI|nr:hypothetical protein P8C59_007222 [Phyllachora maydis]
MLKSRPWRWVCSSCLGRSARLTKQPRWLSIAATDAAAVKAAPDKTATGPAHRHDDALLRQIFDSAAAWKHFSHAGHVGHAHAGLFRNAYLTHPAGFLVFAQATLARSRRIVDKVLAASTPAEYRVIVQDLDRLSDLLCRVLDLCDFVRATHPRREEQRGAAEAWDLVYEYMNELNTTTGLHDQLARALDDPANRAAWSEEELAVAEVLRLDFTKSAINLPKAARDRFIHLSSEISKTAHLFLNYPAPKQPHVTGPSSAFHGLDPKVAQRVQRRGRILLPSLSAEASTALRTVHDPEMRRQIFCASRTAEDRHVRVLEELMALRAELAQLSGFESYGHLVLRDRMMAKSPEAVKKFLHALVKSNSPLVQREMADLLDVKKQFDPNATKLEPWDRDYCAEQVRRAMRSQVRHQDHLSSYFSLGTVMQGISRICTQLYGIRFVPRETAAGETWHQDVRRLDVVSDTDGHVAVLYCDLFNREAKTMCPAHFTVRCSREILAAEVAEMANAEQHTEALPRFDSPEAAANDGMALSYKDGVLKQLPTIALICDFTQPNDGRGVDRPVLLDFHQLETLFHEMGHAIHSILARTSFQNVAGTRCATDLAELPSTLMEYFAADPCALGLWARHFETDAPLPYAMLADNLRVTRRFSGADTENQIILAMLDQELHSASVPAAAAAAAGRRGPDSTAVYHGLQRAHGNTPPDPDGTSWQGFFGHLSGYGATYYSYIFDRVLAERVWKVVFGAGRDGAALRRDNGERLKESLLRWGGSRDPWACLAAALRDERLVGGGPEAMALVGSWGSAGVGGESL